MNVANVLLNLCVRCGGPMDYHRDRYGDYLRCLRCGQHQPLTGIATGETQGKDQEGFGRHYPDRGCEVSGSCLSCPLPDCKWE